MFRNLLSIFTAITLAIGLATAMAAPAAARDGANLNRETNDGVQKLGRELKVIGTPARTRAKIISSVGLAAGTAVGEVSTTVVTCIAWCFGVDTGYKPGDMSKKAWKGFKKMWGIKESPPKAPKPVRVRPSYREGPVLRRANTGMGTHMGYIAIDR
ncbi:hypothetical protein FQ775_13090 [Nitratireductor mangrovi]|uniref:Uncharacterized protein n=1 Tax=Nitratireductor mangrovi TaxID=2599600 RepID=A0A5B8L0N7_9HYPH|nr:hypothetical protein [Nitratireductor mangrovi]QDZ01240.1 hypothetical protein FQ775_13090 [Nitratireductor mangrovi]